MSTRLPERILTRYRAARTLRRLLRYEEDPCGDGGSGPGFQKGNTCAAGLGGGGQSSSTREPQEQQTNQPPTKQWYNEQTEQMADGALSNDRDLKFWGARANSIVTDSEGDHEGAVANLSYELEAYHEEELQNLIDNGNVAGSMAALIRNSLNNVAWDEVAEHLIDQLV